MESSLSDALKAIESRTPALLGALRELVRFAVALEVSDPESGQVEDVDADLVPRVRRILDGAEGLFGRFLEIYDGDTGYSARVESAGGSREALRGRVADQSFIARMELNHWRASLDMPAGSESWVLIGRCNQALGAFIKAAIALEAIASEIVGQKCLLSHLQSAERSIELRRAFHAFRAAIAAGGTPEEHNLRERIEQASDAISVLLHTQTRERIRLSDRAQLIKLDKRTRDWLSLEGGAEFSVGLHIWQDMLALSELMMQINRREELMEHDARLIGELLARFDEQLPENPVRAWRVELKTLIGRDLELDQLIEDGGEGETAQHLRAILTRVHRELTGQPGDPPESQMR